MMLEEVDEQALRRCIRYYCTIFTIFPVRPRGESTMSHSWIDQVVQMYQENEAPEKFFYWAAMSAISAVTKKQVFLNRYQYKLYPNIYVLIMGESGIKKGLPIHVAKTVVEKVNNTRVISGRKSIQKAIRDMGMAYTTADGKIIHEAQGFLVTGEFAAFLVQDRDALTILTDLYDTDKHPEFWENSLKSTGIDRLKKPCLTLLGATNEEHFNDAVPQNAIGGGFIARTFVALGTERGILNSLTNPPKALPDIDSLVDYLREISKVSGEFKYTTEGKKLYDSWYYEFYTKKYHDPTGTLNRLGDQILKAAMLISLSRGTSLELSQEDIFEAITVCEECINGMMQVTMGGGGVLNLGLVTKAIMRELIMHPQHQLTKADLLRKYQGRFDDFDVTRVAESLQASNAIEISPQGKTMLYIMKKEALDMYTNFKKGIQ